jgi:hypothetical protein
VFNSRFNLKSFQKVYTLSKRFHGPFICDHVEIDSPIDDKAHPWKRTAAELPSVLSHHWAVTFGKKAKEPDVSVPLIKNRPLLTGNHFFFLVF